MKLESKMILKYFEPFRVFSRDFNYTLTSGGRAKKATPYSFAKGGSPVKDEGKAAHLVLGIVSLLP